MKVHPLTKLSIVISLTSCSLLYKNLPILTGLLLISLFLTLINAPDSEAWKKFIRQFYKLLPLFISIFLIQILFDISGVVIYRLWFVQITSHGFNTALQVMLRLLIIVFAAGYLIKLSLRDFLSAFRLIRLPESIAVTTALTIGFIPLISNQIKLSLQQITLRGIRLRKLGFKARITLYLSLIMPILGKSVSKAKYQAIALDFRGFRNGKKHTNYQMQRLGLIDWVLMLISVLLLVLPALGRY